MKDLLFSLLIGGVGFALLFAGYRFARVILAIWGLVMGFLAGSAIVADLMGTQFIGTVLGIVTGVVLGLLFAALAYFYYGVAVVLLGVGIGYSLGSSFIALFGIEPGVLSTTVGVLVGLAFGLGAILFRLPKALLIVVTSFAGAITLIGALLVMFNVIPLEFYSYAAARTVVSNSWIWSLLALVMACAGMVAQTIMDREYRLSEWTISDDEQSHTSITGMHSPTHA